MTRPAFRSPGIAALLLLAVALLALAPTLTFRAARRRLDAARGRMEGDQEGDRRAARRAYRR